MITDFNELTNECLHELYDREYDLALQGFILNEWKLLGHWLETKNLDTFTQTIGYQYCDEVLGGHIILKSMSKRTIKRLRAIRMLTSYQQSGDFEFRSPRVEFLFEGELGLLFNEYLDFLTDVKHLAPSTISCKKLYLYDLYCFIKDIKITPNELIVDRLEDFFRLKNYTSASRRNAGITVKLFLQYIYDKGYTKRDMSIGVMADNYDRHSKLPTTYTEEEIRSAIAQVDRASGIGKRDYLVLLLAAEYGWRAKDITTFRFDEIDWDKNSIRFDQHKTGDAVEFPLLASVGNAIIDYARYGRPESDSPYVILCSEHSKWARPLSSPTIHSIVTQYLCKAKVPNWQTKKHGPHSFRHSLASNMLKREIALPVISTVLGHQTTATTKYYLKIDIEKLRQCPLPMPPLHSKFYRREV